MQFVLILYYVLICYYLAEIPHQPILVTTKITLQNAMVMVEVIADHHQDTEEEEEEEG